MHPHLSSHHPAPHCPSSSSHGRPLPASVPLHAASTPGQQHSQLRSHHRRAPRLDARPALLPTVLHATYSASSTGSPCITSSSGEGLTHSSKHSGGAHHHDTNATEDASRVLTSRITACESIDELRLLLRNKAGLQLSAPGGRASPVPIGISNNSSGSSSSSSNPMPANMPGSFSSGAPPNHAAVPSAFRVPLTDYHVSAVCVRCADLATNPPASKPPSKAGKTSSNMSSTKFRSQRVFQSTDSWRFLSSSSGRGSSTESPDSPADHQDVGGSTQPEQGMRGRGPAQPSTRLRKKQVLAFLREFLQAAYDNGTLTSTKPRLAAICLWGCARAGAHAHTLPFPLAQTLLARALGRPVRAPPPTPNSAPVSTPPSALQNHGGLVFPQMQQGMGHPSTQQGMVFPRTPQDIVSAHAQQGMVSPYNQQGMVSPEASNFLASAQQHTASAQQHAASAQQLAAATAHQLAASAQQRADVAHQHAAASAQQHAAAPALRHAVASAQQHASSAQQHVAASAQQRAAPVLQHAVASAQQHASSAQQRAAASAQQHTAASAQQHAIAPTAPTAQQQGVPPLPQMPVPPAFMMAAPSRPSFGSPSLLAPPQRHSGDSPRPQGSMQSPKVAAVPSASPPQQLGESPQLQALTQSPRAAAALLEPPPSSQSSLAPPRSTPPVPAAQIPPSLASSAHVLTPPELGIRKHGASIAAPTNGSTVRISGGHPHANNNSHLSGVVATVAPASSSIGCAANVAGGSTSVPLSSDAGKQMTPAAVSNVAWRSAGATNSSNVGLRLTPQAASSKTGRCTQAPASSDVGVRLTLQTVSSTAAGSAGAPNSNDTSVRLTPPAVSSIVGGSAWAPTANGAGMLLTPQTVSSTAAGSAGAPTRNDVNVHMTPPAASNVARGAVWAPISSDVGKRLTPQSGSKAAGRSAGAPTSNDVGVRLTAQAVSNMIWALAKMHPQLVVWELTALTPLLLRCLPSMSAAQVTAVVWALATSGARPGPELSELLTEELWSRRPSAFSAREVCTLLEAFVQWSQPRPPAAKRVPAPPVAAAAAAAAPPAVTAGASASAQTPRTTGAASDLGAAVLGTAMHVPATGSGSFGHQQQQSAAAGATSPLPHYPHHAHVSAPVHYRHQDHHHHHHQQQQQQQQSTAAAPTQRLLQIAPTPTPVSSSWATTAAAASKSAKASTAKSTTLRWSLGSASLGHAAHTSLVAAPPIAPTPIALGLQRSFAAQLFSVRMQGQAAARSAVWLLSACTRMRQILPKEVLRRLLQVVTLSMSGLSGAEVAACLQAMASLQAVQQNASAKTASQKAQRRARKSAGSSNYDSATNIKSSGSSSRSSKSTATNTKSGSSGGNIVGTRQIHISSVAGVAAQSWVHAQTTLARRFMSLLPEPSLRAPGSATGSARTPAANSAVSSAASVAGDSMQPRDSLPVVPLDVTGKAFTQALSAMWFMGASQYVSTDVQRVLHCAHVLAQQRGALDRHSIVTLAKLLPDLAIIQTQQQHSVQQQQQQSAEQQRPNFAVQEQRQHHPPHHHNSDSLPPEQQQKQQLNLTSPKAVLRSLLVCSLFMGLRPRQLRQPDQSHTPAAAANHVVQAFQSSNVSAGVKGGIPPNGWHMLDIVALLQCALRLGVKPPRAWLEAVQQKVTATVAVPVGALSEHMHVLDAHTQQKQQQQQQQQQKHEDQGLQQKQGKRMHHHQNHQKQQWPTALEPPQQLLARVCHERALELMHSAHPQSHVEGSSSGCSSSLSPMQQPTLTPDAAALLLVGLPDLGRLWAAEPALVLVAVASAGVARATDVHGDARHGSSTHARFLVRLLRGIGAHAKVLEPLGHPWLPLVAPLLQSVTSLEALGPVGAAHNLSALAAIATPSHPSSLNLPYSPSGTLGRPRNLRTPLKASRPAYTARAHPNSKDPLHTRLCLKATSPHTSLPSGQNSLIARASALASACASARTNSVLHKQPKSIESSSSSSSSSLDGTVSTSHDAQTGYADQISDFLGHSTSARSSASCASVSSSTKSSSTSSQAPLKSSLPVLQKRKLRSVRGFLLPGRLVRSAPQATRNLLVRCQSLGAIAGLLRAMLLLGLPPGPLWLNSMGRSLEVLLDRHPERAQEPRADRHDGISSQGPLLAEDVKEVVCVLLAMRTWAQQELHRAKASEKWRRQSQHCHSSRGSDSFKARDADIGVGDKCWPLDRAAAALTTCRRLGLKIAAVLAEAQEKEEKDEEGADSKGHAISSSSRGSSRKFGNGSAPSSSSSGRSAGNHGTSSSNFLVDSTGSCSSQDATRSDQGRMRERMKNDRIQPALARISDGELRAALRALYCRQPERMEGRKVAALLKRWQ